MAILIVDDETKTREALRNLLTHLGYKTILESKNGEEALRCTEIEKVRIKMIIADYEMPYMDGLKLAQKVGEQPILDLAPFLLITSDLSQSQLVRHQEKITRIDFWLLKPFRMTALSKALSDAYAHRCSTRNQILFIGKSIDPNLKQICQNSSNPLWSEIKLIPSAQALQEYSNPSQPGAALPGAILIDPASLSDLEKTQFNEALTLFKKTPLGTMTPIACLSRNPQEVFHFRTLCQFILPNFWPKSLPKSLQEIEPERWSDLLSTMQTRALNAWSQEALFQQAKSSWTENPSGAMKIVTKILKTDPNHSEAHVMAGEILENLDQSQNAIKHYQKSIDIDPCTPRPYIKLLKLISNTHPTLTNEIVEQAFQFCPQNLDLLFYSANLMKELNQLEKTKTFLEAILKLNPNHEAAQQLLSSLPPT